MAKTQHKKPKYNKTNKNLENIVPKLIKNLSASDENTRYQAAWELSNLPRLEQDIAIYLIKALLDNNDYVRIFAAKTLSNLESKSCNTDVGTSETIDKFGDISREIVNGETVISILIKALNDSEILVQEQAAKELISIAESMETLTPEILDSLLKIAEKLPSGYISDCLEQLKKAKDPKMIPTLINICENISDYYSFGQALEILSNIALTNHLVAKDIICFFERIYEKQKDGYFRPQVIIALKIIGNDDAIAILSRILEDEDSDYKFPAETLGEIGNKLALPALVNVLQNKNIPKYWYYVEQPIVKALGKIGDPRAIPFLNNLSYSNAVAEALRGIKKISRK